MCIITIAHKLPSLCTDLRFLEIMLILVVMCCILLSGALNQWSTALKTCWWRAVLLSSTLAIKSFLTVTLLKNKHLTTGPPGNSSFCFPKISPWETLRFGGNKIKNYRGLFSSVGRVLVCWAGGHRFKPRPDQHAGSLNNWALKKVLSL